MIFVLFNGQIHRHNLWKRFSHPPPSVLIPVTVTKNIYRVFVPVIECFVCVFTFLFPVTHEACALVLLLFHVRKLCSEVSTLSPVAH